MNHKQLTAKEFFDSRASIYHRVSKWTLCEELNLLCDEVLKDLSGDIALELGAGSGIALSRLKNFKRKIALDISAEMLSLITDDSVVKLVGDIHNLNLPEDFADLVICRQVLHYCDLDIAFQNIIQVMKRTGYLHILQVVDFEKVPPEWDLEWASFRGVNHRKHLRVSELEAIYKSYSFEIVINKRLIIRDQYSWSDFFQKHNIDKRSESEVKRFFIETPTYITEEIDLKLDDSEISYNRNVGVWLLKRSK